MRNAEEKAISPLQKFIENRIQFHFESWDSVDESDNIGYETFRRIYLLGLKEGIAQGRTALTQIEQLILESVSHD